MRLKRAIKAFIKAFKEEVPTKKILDHKGDQKKRGRHLPFAFALGFAEIGEIDRFFKRRYLDLF